MNGILYDSPGALQNQDRHKDGYDRVRNVPSEGKHHDSGDDCAYRAECITDNMEVRAAEIDIVLHIPRPHQEPGTEKVSQQADSCNEHHASASDGRRVIKALNRFPYDKAGDDKQGDAI